MSDSPKSARTAFKPISKMASRSILRDRNPPNPPSTDDHDASTRPALHVVTPAKNRMQSLFGKLDRSGSSTPPPVPAIPIHHRASTSGFAAPSTPSAAETRRRQYESGTIIQTEDHLEPPPVPKIRAGMTPEARTRLMPTPKPLPPSKLRSQTGSSASSGTMRLVQPRKSVSQSQRTSLPGDAYDIPLRGESGSPVIEDWDTAMNRSNDYPLADVGWQELGSQSNETVLVTVRCVYSLPMRHIFCF